MRALGGAHEWPEGGLGQKVPFGRDVDLDTVFGPLPPGCHLLFQYSHRRPKQLLTEFTTVFSQEHGTLDLLQIQFLTLVQAVPKRGQPEVWTEVGGHGDVYGQMGVSRKHTHVGRTRQGTRAVTQQFPARSRLPPSFTHPPQARETRASTHRGGVETRWAGDGRGQLFTTHSITHQWSLISSCCVGTWGSDMGI